MKMYRISGSVAGEKFLTNSSPDLLCFQLSEVMENKDFPRPIFNSIKLVVTTASDIFGTGEVT